MEQTIRNGFRIQRAVIWALFHREIKTRFAGFRLGVAWMLLEPMAHIGTFLLIFGLRHTAVRRLKTFRSKPAETSSTEVHGIIVLSTSK